MCGFPPALPLALTFTASQKASRFEHLYQAARASRERLEQLRARTDAESAPSFTPELVARKATSTARKGDEDVASRLYKAAADRKKRLDDLSKSLQETPSFTPKITRRAAKTGGTGSACRAEKLYRDAFRQRERLELERKKSGRELTFRPTITRKARARSAAASRDSDVSVPVEDRLLRSEAEKARKLAARRQELRSKEAAQLTFHPKLRPASRGRAKRDPAAVGAFERLYQHAAAKVQRQKERREAADATTSRRGAFQPEINKRSRRISRGRGAAAEAGAGGTVHERLFREQQVLDEARQQAAKAKREKEEAELERERAAATRRIRRSSAPSGDAPEPVWERLSKTTTRRRKATAPSTHKSSKPRRVRTPSRARPASAASADAGVDIWERLSKETLRRGIDEVSKQVSDEELRECTFRPAINSASRRLTRADKPDEQIWQRLSASASADRPSSEPRAEES